MNEPIQPIQTSKKPNVFKRLWHYLLSLYHPEQIRQRGWAFGIGLFIVTYAVIVLILSFVWGSEPSQFDVQKAAQARAEQYKERWDTTGYVMTNTLIEMTTRLLDKPGGYLSNDRFPPGVLMDNIPSWEFGVLTQIRDFTKALRNDLSRSQTQSTEDIDLVKADPAFNIDSKSWLMPSAEKEYREGAAAVERYLHRLANPKERNAQFFSRADNLRDWFKTVEKRLGSLSQRLSASVGQTRLNTDLAGDPSAKQSTPQLSELELQTPWSQIDEIFYEARGTSWALIHLLHAVEIDFKDVLEKKNATVSLRQIIRELESTQKTIWSPMILNGSDFGLFANHSLVMSSYISRANAGIIDLRSLLTQG